MSTEFSDRTGEPQSTTTETPAAQPTAAPPASAAPTVRRTRTTVLRGPGPAYRLRELIWLAAGVVDAFLALDFIFRAVAATPDGFVSVVRTVGDALTTPFSGLIRGTIPTVGHTADWAALVAIVVYTVAAWVLVRLLRIATGSGYRAVVPS